MKQLRPVLALASCAAVLAGCGEEPVTLDSSTAALTADRNFRRMAVEVAASARFLAESELVLGFVPAAECDEYGDCTTADLDYSEDAEALADWLAAHVFTEANVESEDGGTVTFRLRSNVVCEAGDEGCIDLLDRLPIRLEVSSPEEGDLDVALLVGTSRHNPLDLGLYRNELSAEIDLAALQRTVRTVAEVTGGSTEGLPEIMAGRVDFSLVRHGDDDFSASASVLEEVNVGSADPASYQLRLAAAIPAWSARVDGAAETVEVAVGLGAVDLRAPLQFLFGSDEAEETCEFDDAGNQQCWLEPPTSYEGTTSIQLAGLTGAATLTAGEQEELRLNGISLGGGTSSVSVDGAPILSVDLNPDTGRQFDLVATQTDGATTLTVSPGFDLRLLFSTAHVADQLDVPEWTLEENLRIRLDGAAAPKVELGDFTKVLDGTLTLESSEGTISVAAGMCLVTDAEVVEVEHPFAGLISSACE